MRPANRIWWLYKSTLEEKYEQLVVQMNRKTHILKAKKITEARNPKRSSKFVRGYGVLRSMSRNLMSLFKKIVSLYNIIYFFVILCPTSLASLVTEVATGHSHQILLESTIQCSAVCYWLGANTKWSLCLQCCICKLSQRLLLRRVLLDWLHERHAVSNVKRSL